MINYDGSWDKNSDKGGLGFVCGNNRRDLLAASVFYQSIDSVEMLEAFANKESLLLASNLKWDKVEIESDCQIIVNAISNDGFTPWNCLGVIRDIPALKYLFAYCAFSFVKREACADWLAS